MPKKKLTKAQVKRKFKIITSNMYALFNDKLEHLNSDVPMSADLVFKTFKQLRSFEKRVK